MPPPEKGDVETVVARAEAGVISLEATVTLDADALSVRYRATNATDAPVVVYDLLTPVRSEDATPGAFDPLLAYVSFEDPDTLAVKRVPLPLPSFPGPRIVPTPACATRPIEPGGVLSGRAVVRLPAREYNPFFPPGFTAVYRKAVATRLRFVLGYAAWFRNPPVPRAFVETVVPLPRPIPVKRRSDPFEGI